MAATRLVFLFIFFQSFMGEKIFSNEVTGAEQVDAEETFEQLPFDMGERVDDLSRILNGNVEAMAELACDGQANIVNLAQIVLDQQLSAIRLAAMKGILDHFTTFIKKMGHFDYDDWVDSYDFVKYKVGTDLKEFFKLDSEAVAAREVFIDNRGTYLNKRQPTYDIGVEDFHALGDFVRICSEKGILQKLKSYYTENNGNIVVNMDVVMDQLIELSGHDSEDSPTIVPIGILSKFTPCMEEISFYVTSIAKLVIAYRDFTEIKLKMESTSQYVRTIILSTYFAMFVSFCYYLIKILRKNTKFGSNGEKEKSKKDKNKNRKRREKNNNVDKKDDNKEVPMNNSEDVSETKESKILPFWELIARVLDMKIFANKPHSDTKLYETDETFLKTSSVKDSKSVSSKDINDNESEIKCVEFVETILQGEDGGSVSSDTDDTPQDFTSPDTDDNPQDFTSPDTDDKPQDFTSPDTDDPPLDFTSLCWRCSKTGVRLFKCSGCRKARYCSRDCIAQDWAEHGGYCIKVQNRK